MPLATETVDAHGDPVPEGARADVQTGELKSLRTIKNENSMWVFSEKYRAVEKVDGRNRMSVVRSHIVKTRSPPSDARGTRER